MKKSVSAVTIIFIVCSLSASAFAARQNITVDPTAYGDGGSTPETDGATFQIDADYNVGDGVSVICDKFDVNEWLWIYERKIEIQENDELTVNLVVGN